MLNRLMNMFRKNEDDNQPLQQVPAIDLSLVYERLDEFRQYLLKKDYATFCREYEAITWDAKTLLNEGLGLDERMSPAIEKWVAEQPGSYIARLFAAVSATCLAWIARTAARGAAVSDERAETFLSLLEKAHGHLTEADRLNPDDAEICARMIRVCMGLGIDREVTESYFDAAIQLVPNHLMAHLMMINFLNPKWGGSLEEMQNFAMMQIQETGSSLLITLRLFAIAEEWLYYDLNDEKEKKKAFFQTTELREEVMVLYAAYTEEEDGRLLVPYVYNYFAFVFYMSGQKELARELIKKIPGKMTVYPWAYLGISSNKDLQKL